MKFKNSAQTVIFLVGIGLLAEGVGLGGQGGRSTISVQGQIVSLGGVPIPGNIVLTDRLSPARDS